MRVNRRLGVVAWIAATVLSVAASTAAVAAVREQVTDGPALVSLATLRRAAEVDPASPQLGAIPEDTVTTTSPPATTTTTETPGTTRPDVEAVPDTIVETTSTTSVTTTTEPPTTTTTGGDGDRNDEPPGGDDSGEARRDFRGGSVTIGYDGEDLFLIEATTDDGYDYEIEEQSDRELVMRFSDGDKKDTVVVATVSRGRIQIRTY